MKIIVDALIVICESTDTIAHLKAKIHAIRGILPHEQRLVHDGKLLGHHFSENMMLADVGVQEGSMIYLKIWKTGATIRIEKLSKSLRIPEIGYLYYADAFKSGWREEHGEILLNLLLKLCQDGAISKGNITEDTWLCIQNGLKNSTQCCFEIDFLEERLRDYKQLYTLLSETTSSIFVWDCGNKTIHVKSDLWRKYHPEMLLLCDAYIPYFDTLEGVCLLLDTRRSSEQLVSETSTNINNRKLVHQHRHLPSTMKIFVKRLTGEVYSLECKSTDTIAHLQEKLYAAEGTRPDNQRLYSSEFRPLGRHFSACTTLFEEDIQEGSVISLLDPLRGGGGGEIERPRRPENFNHYFADTYKFGWSEEHGKLLLHLLLKLCHESAISEGNITEGAWSWIQNGINISKNYNFEIYFLKERLREYKQLYSLLAETSSPIFHWDREKKTIIIMNSKWREYHPELLLLSGPYIPYFDTLKEVCLLLNTRRSSEQQVSETSTNIKMEKLVDRYRKIERPQSDQPSQPQGNLHLSQNNRRSSEQQVSETSTSIDNVEPDDQQLGDLLCEMCNIPLQGDLNLKVKMERLKNLGFNVRLTSSSESSFSDSSPISASRSPDDSHSNCPQ